MPEVRRARTHGPPIYNKIKNLEGWGELSINNLRDAINKSKIIELYGEIHNKEISRTIGQTNKEKIYSQIKNL